MTGRFFRGEAWVRPLWKAYAWSRPLHLTSGYGLFAVMTTTRDEIQIEGSQDGEHWLPYQFKWKPNSAQDRPRFVEPHQPRLDWQMWFAALRSYRGAPWIHNFMIRLLQGSDDVLGLLKTNPFPVSPPKHIRARVARYQFTDWKTKQETGDWWTVGPERAYSPVLSR